MEVVYVLFRYWPLNWQGEGWNSQNARRTNSCYVPPEPRPENIPTIWESCVKIPDILPCGRYMILYTLVCQSNIRPTPLSESNQSAKISRQSPRCNRGFTPGRLGVGVGGKRRKCMNGKYSKRRWMSMSQVGSDKKNYTPCHDWDSSHSAVHQDQRQTEHCRALSASLSFLSL